MQTEKMIRMANQIAAFFGTQTGADGGPAGAEGVAAHVNDFWAPDMRAALLAHAAAGGAGLDPLVLQAAPAIRPAPAADPILETR